MAFAEFFRFIGVFVCEDIIGNSLKGPKAPKEDDTQLVIWLQSDLPDSQETIASDKAFLPIDVSQDDWSGITFENLNSQKSLFEEQLGKIEVLLGDIGVSFPKESYGKLFNVYVDNNVALAAANLQYYRFKTPIHQDSERTFLRALDTLQAIGTGQGINDTLMYEYAVLYSKQKVNQAGLLYKEDKDVKFKLYKLVPECKKAIDRYPGSANLKVLLGLITENASDGYSAAVEAYQDALKMIGRQTYASHIYYWLGHLHERKKLNMNAAKHAYANAYLLQKKYRNIYKVAVMFEAEQNYSRMMDFLTECLDALERYRIKEMDPLEMEYYYKVCALLCTRYLDYFKDSESCIRYGEMAIQFYESVIQCSRYFESIYGEVTAHVYQKVSAGRAKLVRVYEKLALAYRNIGDTETSEKYRSMF